VLICSFFISNFIDCFLVAIPEMKFNNLGRIFQDLIRLMSGSCISVGTSDDNLFVSKGKDLLL
jgi:hypothetical protein